MRPVSASSQLTGSIRITTKAEPEGAPAAPRAKANGAVPVSKDGQPEAPAAAEPPACRPAPDRPN